MWNQEVSAGTVHWHHKLILSVARSKEVVVSGGLRPSYIIANVGLGEGGDVTGARERA
jgi:hypothetical protein